jgi:predicted N-acetyltransferase YhbS
MNIEIVETLDKELVQFIDKKLDEFNFARWEVKEVKPLAVKVTESNGEIVAGSSGRTFGYWLLLDTLWVSEHLRGQDLGSKILDQMETSAKNRGCKFILLDTLNFQAKPFYEKHGYKLQWTQNFYPKVGCKYFMVKEIK